MLYVNIQKVASPSLYYIKRKWEEELELDISDVEWRWAVELIHSSSVCVRHGSIQFKGLHRLHFTRVKLARIYQGADPTCPRCKRVPANICHMFWSCPSPLAAIFGMAPGETQLTMAQRKAIAF